MELYFKKLLIKFYVLLLIRADNSEEKSSPASTANNDCWPVWLQNNVCANHGGQ